MLAIITVFISSKGLIQYHAKFYLKGEVSRRKTEVSSQLIRWAWACRGGWLEVWAVLDLFY